MASIPVVEVLRFARIVQIFRVIRLLKSSHHIITHIRNNRREATIASIFLLLTVLITVGSSMMLMFEGKAPGSMQAMPCGGSLSRYQPSVTVITIRSPPSARCSQQ